MLRMENFLSAGWLSDAHGRSDDEDLEVEHIKRLAEKRFSKSTVGMTYAPERLS